MYIEDKENKAFYEEYKPQIIAYEIALKELAKSGYRTLSIPELSDKYAVLEQKLTLWKNTPIKTSCSTIFNRQRKMRIYTLTIILKNKAL